MSTALPPFRFDVAFSFAGPHRDKVRAMAELLTAKLGQGSVFFDQWYEHEILGDDMDVLLQRLYHKESLLVVADLSEDYAGRPWCQAEARAIRALRLEIDPARDETQRLRLLNVRFAPGDVPGVLTTTGYLDASGKTAEQCADLILKRLALLRERLAASPPSPSAKSPDHPSAQARAAGSPGAGPGPVSAPGDRGAPAGSVTRRHCKLSCKESTYDGLHLRNSSFLASLCRKFPNTTFRLLRPAAGPGDESEPVDPKNVTELVTAQFQHGEVVTLEVSGDLQVMAAEFFKVAWENLEGYSDNVMATKGRLVKLIDQAWSRIFEPDLVGAGWDHTSFIADEPVPAPEEEHRCVAIINDRLHNLSLPMIPLIAKHFGCRVQISFDLPEKGIFSFAMEPSNNYDLNKRILELEIGVGARITVAALGKNSEAACHAVRDVLENLWQCDQWVRRRGKDLQGANPVPDLLEFAKDMRKLQTNEYGYVQSPFISGVLTRKHVFVNVAGIGFSKEAVLQQLAGPHVRTHGLDPAHILAQVQEAEQRQTVVLRPGFAVAHAALDGGPRISITFGVYPDGVDWSAEEHAAKLVAMVICARDTYRTWRDYMKRFAILFRTNPTLLSHLVAAQGTTEFLAILRHAETRLIKP